MSKKILFYGNADYGQVFWDQDNNLITTIHENDGDFRDEYMGSLLSHFGIEVKFKKVPKEVKKSSLEYGVWEY